MRVLVLEGTPGAGVTASEQLTAAGHAVTSCHDGPSSFPCRGLGGGGGCPIEDGAPIDAALLIRDTAGPEPTATEDGVRCALRRHIPLAIAGELEDNPYLSFAAATSNGFDHIVGVTEEAVEAPMAGHAGIARNALVKVLESEGLDATAADVAVRRNGSTLSVDLVPGTVLDSTLLDTASVRVLAAVRAHDRAASIIDVSVTQPGLAAT